MIIQTERLVLRPFCKLDKEWYSDFAKDEELQKRLPGLACLEKEEVDLCIKLFEEGDFINDFYFVIEDKEKNIVGVAVAVRITSTTLDVSYFINNNYRNKGYMYEALNSMIGEIRKEEPLYRFRMIVDEDNTYSLNVLKKFKASWDKVDSRYVCFV